VAGQVKGIVSKQLLQWRQHFARNKAAGAAGGAGGASAASPRVGVGKCGKLRRSASGGVLLKHSASGGVLLNKQHVEGLQALPPALLEHLMQVVREGGSGRARRCCTRSNRRQCLQQGSRTAANRQSFRSALTARPTDPSPPFSPPPRPRIFLSAGVPHLRPGL
jgi:hypothetical protein